MEGSMPGKVEPRTCVKLVSGVEDIPAIAGIGTVAECWRQGGGNSIGAIGISFLYDPGGIRQGDDVPIRIL